MCSSSARDPPARGPRATWPRAGASCPADRRQPPAREAVRRRPHRALGRHAAATCSRGAVRAPSSACVSSPPRSDVIRIRRARGRHRHRHRRSLPRRTGPRSRRWSLSAGARSTARWSTRRAKSGADLIPERAVDCAPTTAASGSRRAAPLARPMLIGADGANSLVRRRLHRPLPRVALVHCHGRLRARRVAAARS